MRSTFPFSFDWLESTSTKYSCRFDRISTRIIGPTSIRALSRIRVILCASECFCTIQNKLTLNCTNTANILAILLANLLTNLGLPDETRLIVNYLQQWFLVKLNILEICCQAHNSDQLFRIYNELQKYSHLFNSKL